MPPPLATLSTHTQRGGIQKNKGKQIAHRRKPLPPLEMPTIFITPKPHTTFIPQILKDQACANKEDKAR